MEEFNKVYDAIEIFILSKIEDKPDGIEEWAYKIDELMDENECNEFDVWYDSETKGIFVELNCDDITVLSDNLIVFGDEEHALFELMKLSQSVVFCIAEEECKLRVRFEF